VTAELYVHRYGPSAPVQMLAIHGLTGYGGRWQHLAAGLPEISIAAPDLLGHGRSSWAAPWSLDANVSAFTQLLDDEADAPVLVVGHSFGGAIALRLAALRPDKVAALLLLDPAVGLDGAWMGQIAEAMFRFPDYTDAAEARTEKMAGSWGDVDPALLDTELNEHLVQLPNGRCGWRVSMPAMMSYWSELARDVVLPHPGTTTTLVRAKWTSPPYVTDQLIDALRQQLGADFQLLDFECNHMVPNAKPVEVAALIREHFQER
jgi:lipase